MKKEFKEERESLNRIVMKYAGTNTKRFWSLDSQIYTEGSLPVKIKELMGLVASLVLRCDDCIRYHLERCHDEKVTNEELEEALAIALIVGGSITIPHVRRVFLFWDEMAGTGDSGGL